MILILFPIGASAVDPEIELQMLNAQVERLETEHAQKYAELKKCEKTTKNFKIAGISTLGATAVGIYSNIKLHEKLSRLKKVSSGGGTVKQTVSQEMASNLASDVDDCVRDCNANAECEYTTPGC